MKRLLFVLSFAALSATLLTAPAEAAFEITFTSGANTYVAVDNTINDAAVAPGVIIVDPPLLSFAGYQIVLSTGSQFTSGAQSPGLGLVNLAISNQSATDPLVITITANDYSFPTGPSQLFSSASFSTTTTGSGTYSWASYYCATNALYCTSGVAAPVIPLAWSGPAGSGGTTLSPVFTSTVPYSLTSVGTVTLSAGDSIVLTTGSSRVLGVPEPGSLTLLGTGLFGIAGFLRRRRASAR